MASSANVSQASMRESQLDEQFIVYMLEVDGRYKSMTKQDRIRVEQWSKVLCQANSSFVWKKNRNLYSMLLLDCVLNNSLVKPFSSPPPTSATKPQNVNNSVHWRRQNESLSGDGGLGIPSLSGEEVLQHNDFVLPILQKKQVLSSLSIRFKHLKLEVDKQRIVDQLSQGEADSVALESQVIHSYGEEMDHLEEQQCVNHDQKHTNQQYKHRQHKNTYLIDEDENPRPQQPTSSAVRPKDKKPQKRQGSQRQSVRAVEQVENMQQNFQEHQAEMMLRLAEEQLKLYDLPRQQTEVSSYKREIFQLKEQNRAIICQVAQLQTQLEVQQIGEKHLREQMGVKDQMLAMQEDMLNQLHQEVEQLKLMLLAKDQAQLSKIKQPKVVQLKEFQTEETMRMMDTAKAPQVPPIIIQKETATKLNVNRSKGKQLIVPDELKEEKRFQKQREQQQQNQPKYASDLLKSNISLSDSDDRSIQNVEQTHQNYAKFQIDCDLQGFKKGTSGSDDLGQSPRNNATIGLKMSNNRANEDGTTLQFQNYIKSCDDDMNSFQDSLLVSQQQSNPQVKEEVKSQLHRPEIIYYESQNDDDRFLEEVLLSRKPQYTKQQLKNEFLPRAILQTIQEGEMSLQDLSHDISAVLPNEIRSNQACNKTVNCSCGCEDDDSFCQVNRTQQEYRNLKRLKEQREFYSQINTEIANCTQDNTEDFDQSHATSNGSPARLLDQLLASQGASAFQPQFNYKQHLQNQQKRAQAKQKRDTQIPHSIHGSNGEQQIFGMKSFTPKDQQTGTDMSSAQQSLNTESQFERFYTDLIT